MANDEQEHSRGFKVEDRRRFSESGEVRDAAAEAPAPPPTEAPAPEAPPTSTGEAAGPEINFATFIISLSTQALANLGEIPDPLERSTRIDLPAARQIIDILGLLRDKTTGNLDEAERALLDAALYDLRMKYVERAHGR